MPSHFEFLRFKLFTPEYRAIHDNALRSAELFVQCAKGEAVEAAFQKKLSLVAPDGTLDAQAVSCWERIYINRLFGLRFEGDDATPVTAPMRIVNEMSSDRTRYEALQTGLSARKSATPDSIELTTISHGSADSPVEVVEDGVRENAHAMAELFIMAFKKTHRKFEDFDKHATAVKLDDFMSWVKLRKEVECSKIMTWYSDRYKELCAQRAKLLEKNPEGKEKLMGAWTQCYEDALKRLNMGDEKNEGLRHYFKRQIKMKRRTADFCKDYAEDHKSRADKDVGCNLAEIRATVERTHKKLPLDLSLVLPTTLAFEYIDIDEIKQNAKEMAKSFVKQHIDLYLYCSPVHTTEQFDELSKNQAEIMRKLSALVRRGFNFDRFVLAKCYNANYARLLADRENLCYAADSVPEKREYLNRVWQKHYEQALAVGRASLIEKGILQVEVAATPLTMGL